MTWNQIEALRERYITENDKLHENLIDYGSSDDDLFSAWDAIGILFVALDDVNNQLRIGHAIVVEMMEFAGSMGGVDWGRLNDWLVEREREKREYEASSV